VKVYLFLKLRPCGKNFYVSNINVWYLLTIIIVSYNFLLSGVIKIYTMIKKL